MSIQLRRADLERRKLNLKKKKQDIYMVKSVYKHS